MRSNVCLARVCFHSDCFVDLVQVFFPGQMFSAISSSVSLFAFALVNSITSVTGPAPFGRVTAVPFQTPSGLVGANITVPTADAQTALATAVVQNSLTFSYLSRTYTAAFSSSYGVCPDGTVSATGHAPGCQTCPANTFVGHLLCCRRNFHIFLGKQSKHHLC
jgi:hypothetical protein